MKKMLIILILLLIFVSLTAAEAEGEKAEKARINWFNVIFAGGYLLGVFILLPLVIFTNLKDKVYDPEDKEQIQPLENLSEEERNARAARILEEIGNKLTPVEDEEGNQMITITKSKQARFVRNGLNYIIKKLAPTDQDVIDRVNEFKGVYDYRASRIFTGSNWIIVFGIGVGVLLVATGGFNTFIIIHALGVLFYILSSRTPLYAVEKRVKNYGSGGGAMSKIYAALFLGPGKKYYVKRAGGSWERDWQTEGEMAVIGIVIMAIVALLLGFFAAAMGVINFIFNYASSLVIPFKKLDDWYERKIEATA